MLWQKQEERGYTKEKLENSLIFLQHPFFRCHLRNIVTFANLVIIQYCK